MRKVTQWLSMTRGWADGEGQEEELQKKTLSKKDMLIIFLGVIVYFIFR